MAGFAAENILQNKSRIFYWNEYNKVTSEDILIDVRTKNEYSAGKILNAINIPVDELRNRISEIPKDKKIYIYCLGGLRGYIAQRILLQNGYNNVLNQSGGYQIWETCTKEEILTNNIVEAKILSNEIR
jgi:rhodanese-related sulfurtransferase